MGKTQSYYEKHHLTSQTQKREIKQPGEDVVKRRPHYESKKKQLTEKKNGVERNSNMENLPTYRIVQSQEKRIYLIQYKLTKTSPLQSRPTEAEGGRREILTKKRGIIEKTTNGGKGRAGG